MFNTRWPDFVDSKTLAAGNCSGAYLELLTKHEERLEMTRLRLKVYISEIKEFDNEKGQQQALLTVHHGVPSSLKCVPSNVRS